jgi:phosphatidylglycerol:prolipoprotein diacylglycerol transferase
MFFIAGVVVTFVLAVLAGTRRETRRGGRLSSGKRVLLAGCLQGDPLRCGETPVGGVPLRSGSSEIRTGMSLSGLLAWLLLGASAVAGWLLASKVLGMRPEVLSGAWDAGQLPDSHAKTWAGGMVGAAAAVVVVARWLRIRVPVAADAFAIAMLAGLAVGRAGCVLDGCCFGKPTALAWGIAWPAGSPVYALQVAAGLIPAHAAWSLPVHPTQLFDLVGVLAVVLVLLVLRPRLRRAGSLFLLAVVGYGLVRFAEEFLREGGVSLAGLTLVQWALLVIVPAAAFRLVWVRLCVRGCQNDEPGRRGTLPTGVSPQRGRSPRMRPARNNEASCGGVCGGSLASGRSPSGSATCLAVGRADHADRGARVVSDRKESPPRFAPAALDAHGVRAGLVAVGLAVFALLVRGWFTPLENLGLVVCLLPALSFAVADAARRLPGRLGAHYRTAGVSCAALFLFAAMPAGDGGGEKRDKLAVEVGGGGASWEGEDCDNVRYVDHSAAGQVGVSYTQDFGNTWRLKYGGRGIFGRIWRTEGTESEDTYWGVRPPLGFFALNPYVELHQRWFALGLGVMYMGGFSSPGSPEFMEDSDEPGYVPTMMVRLGPEDIFYLESHFLESPVPVWPAPVTVLLGVPLGDGLLLRPGVVWSTLGTATPQAFMSGSFPLHLEAGTLTLSPYVSGSMSDELGSTVGLNISWEWLVGE